MVNDRGSQTWNESENQPWAFASGLPIFNPGGRQQIHDEKQNQPTKQTQKCECMQRKAGRRALIAAMHPPRAGSSKNIHHRHDARELELRRPREQKQGDSVPCTPWWRAGLMLKVSTSFRVMRRLRVMGLDSDVHHRGRPWLSEQVPLGQRLPQNQERGCHTTVKARGCRGAIELESPCPGWGACPPKVCPPLHRG